MLLVITLLLAFWLPNGWKPRNLTSSPKQVSAAAEQAAVTSRYIELPKIIDF